MIATLGVASCTYLDFASSRFFSGFSHVRLSVPCFSLLVKPSFSFPCISLG